VFGEHRIDATEVRGAELLRERSRRREIAEPCERLDPEEHGLLGQDAARILSFVIVQRSDSVGAVAARLRASRGGISRFVVRRSVDATRMAVPKRKARSLPSRTSASRSVKIRKTCSVASSAWHAETP
jgi:hypothetical protein